MKYCLLFLLLFMLDQTDMSASGISNKDTIEILETFSSPKFDGINDDICWQNTPWQPINQVWIPWGTELDSSDFFGRYKIRWSSQENVLYFLVEVTDDIFSDAYSPGKSAAIYNFDMFEVFLDEDRSGGYHVFDGDANNEIALGQNAENAFAYHIFTDIPIDRSTSSDFTVEDMGGTDWSNRISKYYKNHFPHFILRREGNILIWEFSLIVYNDEYSEGEPGKSRVQLEADKILGISVAYNDDDEPEVDPAQTVRDNFIGSVEVKEIAYNDHWKNADDFGVFKLKTSRK